jgi:DNA-directed RNA polymerase specialized sigma24 family protein
MDNERQRTRGAWLALRCQLGEASAYRELVTEFERPLAYFVANLIGDRDAAWDVLQLVWIRVFRQIRRLQNPEQLRAWLYGIAHGLTVDHLRKRDSVQRVEREYAE